MWLILACTATSEYKDVDTSSFIDTADTAVVEVVEDIDTGDWPEHLWVVIGSGTWHTCAVDQEKQTHCWGRGLEGQTAPPSGIPFRELTGGRAFTCGLAFDSSVYCWGEYSFPVPEEKMASISAGKDFLCGILHSGSLGCFGFSGEIPVGSFVQLDAGENHVCALSTTQTVSCFGQNLYGESEPPTDTFDLVRAGLYHSCARNEEGIQCWGSPQDNATSIPLVHGNGLWTGNYHNCVLNDNQQAVCWGGDSLGLNGGIMGAKFRDLALGGFHTCGITNEDTIVCVGENSQGQTNAPMQE